MQWSDEAIILGTRRHGETSLIVELMTQAHGRHLGLVRGGRSRRQQPALQAGNSVLATWRARLDEHLGNFAIELTKARAGMLMESASPLFAFQSLAALLRLLPERDPHGNLYTALDTIAEALEEPAHAAEYVVRFELLILNELGFGLDLSSCPVTGEDRDLFYVSPRSGRAVSGEAGHDYRDKLLRLPSFLLVEESKRPAREELLAAFRLTGFFLDRHVLAPRGLHFSLARQSLIGLLQVGSRAA
jgi:DNA repair protein RecO (recombination protein O)